jgi:hypothetical protein
MCRLLLLVLPFCTVAYAQIENCASFSRIIDKIVNAKPTDNIDPDLMALIDVGQTGRCFAQYMVEVGTQDQNKSLFERFVQGFENSRTDQQTGAGPDSTGSTSAVAEGAVARALSVATEYGALTESVSGQVVTLKGNAAGLPATLVRNNIFPYCVGDESQNQFCVKSSVLSLLRRLSFSSSFDASRDSQTLNGMATASSTQAGGGTAAQAVTFTGRKRELTALAQGLNCGTLGTSRPIVSKKHGRARLGKR